MDVVIPETFPETQGHTGPTQASTSATALKRTASEAFQNTPDEEESCKKSRDDSAGTIRVEGGSDSGVNVNGNMLADNLEEELQCGCCSAIVYRPVVVAPCQHFFCGSCMTLWIRNGGTSCPACRSISNSVSFSRPLQKVVDTLLRHAPGKARSVSERMQADAIYQPGLHLRIPSPRQASPEPNVPTANGVYIRPCPHCLPGNQWGWRCPQPIIDPDMDPNAAWLAEEGSPPGHGVCGNCENILALQAPTTTRCDFCQVSFCGIGIPQRCIATSLMLQHPHGLADLSDLIQCGEVYDCFEGNTVEVDILLDYLNAQRLSPRHIYREIVVHIQNQPRQFAPLIELDLFLDLHPVPGGIDLNPGAPRNKICRICATEVFLYGLRDWWIRERKKGFLEEHVMARPDCPDGSQCIRQKNHAHAKEFNHMIGGAPLDPHAPHPAPLVPGPVPPVNPAPQMPDVPPPAQDAPPVLANARNMSPSDDDAAILAAMLGPVNLPLVPVADLAGFASVQSSQDYRDEVEALL